MSSTAEKYARLLKCLAVSIIHHRIENEKNKSHSQNDYVSHYNLHNESNRKQLSDW
jgi:hypothetical protein